MAPRRVLAIARHALRTNLRTGMTRGGLALFTVVVLLGPVIAALRGGGWALDDDLVLTGFVAGAVLALRSGMVEHRLSGLDLFLRQNFVHPTEHVAGAALSLLGGWAVLCAFAFGLVLLLIGDPARATWIAWILALRSAPLLPFVLIVESVSELRVPFFVPAFLYFALLIVMTIAIGVERTIAITGPPVDRADPASSLPLALRAAVMLPIGLLVVLAGTAIRARLHDRRVRTVPYGH